MLTMTAKLFLNVKELQGRDSMDLCVDKYLLCALVSQDDGTSGYVLGYFITFMASCSIFGR